MESSEFEKIGQNDDQSSSITKLEKKDTVKEIFQINLNEV